MLRWLGSQRSIRVGIRDRFVRFAESMIVLEVIRFASTYGHLEKSEIA
jgi:hypothetical protein